MSWLNVGNIGRPIKLPYDVLISAPGIFRMSDDERAHMTASCHDADYIPKVAMAGSIKKLGKSWVQILHNGLVVERDGYVGPWMTELIKVLKGHHEPQEEKAFYEVLKKITKRKASMIELGANWSYYSLWFNKHVECPLNICVEPDPANLALGERNQALNNSKNMVFINAAAGSKEAAETTVALESEPGKKINIGVATIDGMVEKYNIKFLDLLHMDIQGFELDALRGAEKTISSRKLRFLFVSTHHYVFSGSTMTHEDCLEFIESRGGHIITSHTVAESFSGDGLIVASFDKDDIGFVVDTSLNHTDQSLFRPYEADLDLLIKYYGRRRQMAKD